MDGRTDPASFEAKFSADDDPWDYESSDYERSKRDATIAALDGRFFAHALELGCAIGALTEQLAPRCGALLSIDTSPSALDRARARLAGEEHVTFAQATLPEELPRGAWDLVMASEVLYYFPEPELAGLLDALLADLVPGGLLVAVQWRPLAPDHALLGDRVRRIVRARPELELVRRTTTELYVLDVLQKRSAASA